MLVFFYIKLILQLLGSLIFLGALVRGLKIVDNRFLNYPNGIVVRNGRIVSCGIDNVSESKFVGGIVIGNYNTKGVNKLINIHECLFS